MPSDPVRIEDNDSGIVANVTKMSPTSNVGALDVHVVNPAGGTPAQIGIDPTQNTVKLDQTAGANGVTLKAGEAHAGAVGGNTVVKKIAGATVAATANTYADGQLIGALITLTDIARVDSGTITLMAIIAQDLSNQKSAIDFVFFDANPTNTTFTNNAALDIVDADLPKIVGRVSMLASDYASYADNATGIVRNIGLPMQANSSGDMYMCLVCRGAPTYVANELSLVVAAYQD